MLASMWSAWRFKSPSILLCLCTDEYPLMVAGSCQYHGWRSKVRLSDYMRCVVCLDLSGHTTSPCVLSLCKTLFRVLRNAIGGSWLPPGVGWSTRVALRVV